MALSAFAIFAAPATATPEKLRDSPQHLRQNIFLVLGRADSGGGLGNFHHRTKWHPVTRPERCLSHSLDLYGATAGGSVSHQGALEASGKNGSVQSSGSVTKDANGNVNGQRTTDATGKNGNTYQGMTTDTNGQITHSATCADASR